jgi:uncharacterized protein (DUF433 family)
MGPGTKRSVLASCSATLERSTRQQHGWRWRKRRQPRAAIAALRDRGSIESIQSISSNSPPAERIDRQTPDMTSQPTSFSPMMSPSLLERITIEPGKCGGRPCIRGTRMRVSDVLELLANGASIEEVLEDHPTLHRDDILAAIAYAAVQTSHSVVRVA